MNTLPTYKDGSDTRPYLFVSKSAEKYISGTTVEKSFNVRYLEPFSALPAPVSAHADMLVNKIDDVIVVFYDYIEKHPFDNDFYERAKIIYEPNTPGDKYPYDIPLNYLYVNNHIIGKNGYMSEKLRELTDKKNVPLIPIKQGYARCSTLIAENCGATSDKMICKTLRNIGIDILLIESGNIFLDGYNCGFIGGASFFYDDTVYFFGDPLSHPDGKKIIDHLNKHKIKVYTLGDGPLTDLGGAVTY